MDILAEKDGRIYGVIGIERPAAFDSPFADVLFPCLIWDHGGGFTDAQRSEVARALIEAGCRYAVCGGANCEAWHNAVDSEFVKQHLDDPDVDAQAVHVMTTSHEHESANDVAFFFVFCTNFEDHDFKRYLLLHVGSGPSKERVNAAVREYALGET